MFLAGDVVLGMKEELFSIKACLNANDKQGMVSMDHGSARKLQKIFLDNGEKIIAWESQE